jgi:hypothetical protein
MLLSISIAHRGIVTLSAETRVQNMITCKAIYLLFATAYDVFDISRQSTSRI